MRSYVDQAGEEATKEERISSPGPSILVDEDDEDQGRAGEGNQLLLPLVAGTGAEGEDQAHSELGV